MSFSRRTFLKLAGLGATGAALGWRPGGAGSATASWAGARPVPTLRILATNRALSPATVQAFGESTSVPVDLVWAEGDLSLPGFDLAVVPAHTLTGLIQRGEVRELAPISIPFPAEQRAYDPFNTFSVPAARGAIGINALGFTPPDSWAEFFSLARVTPTYAPRAETFGAALKMIGESVNARDAMARKAARELVSGLNSVSLMDARMAVGAGRPGWEFAVPSEGAELWEDCFCLPVDSRQPDLAGDFVRFALDAQPLIPLPENIPLEPRSPFAPGVI